MLESKNGIPVAVSFPRRFFTPFSLRPLSAAELATMITPHNATESADGQHPDQDKAQTVLAALEDVERRLNLR